MPGCIIRERTYDRNEEVIYVIEGKGFARIDEVDIPIEDQSPPPSCGISCLAVLTDFSNRLVIPRRPGTIGGAIRATRQPHRD